MKTMDVASPKMEAVVTTLVSAIATVVFFLHLITKLLKNKKGKKEQQKLPPSPPSLPFLGHLHHLKKPLHQSLARISALHGPILLLRFGVRRVLTVSSFALAEECFTTNDVALAGRPHFPSTAVTTYNHTSLPVASYGPDWREMRRIAMFEGLSGHRLSSLADVRLEEARSLARNLFRDSGMREDTFVKVDLRPRLFGLSMNVIMRIIAGKRYYGEKADDASEVQRFEEIITEIFTYSGASNISDFLPPAVRWIAQRGVDRKLSRFQNYRDRIFQSLIDERRSKRKEDEKERMRDNKTMIDALLSLQEKQPQQYSDDFIKALIVSLQSAGTDTSSNTMEWAMSLLVNNPEKLDKAREEIDNEVGNSRLLEESDLSNKLSYLHCIVNETLRLYPAGPLLVPHEVREECKVGGYDIPEGTVVLVNAYAIQRDPKLWEEPSKFLPERFLEAGIKKGERMLPFGMGRRKCPGEALAMREVGLVLGTLIQCFEWKRVGEEEVDMTQGSGISLPRARPLQAMCKPRHVMLGVLSHIFSYHRNITETT